MKSTFSAFVWRLFINQFAMMACGVIIRGMFLVFFPESMTMANAAALLILVLSMAGQYHIAWKIGERDRNLVKFNHITYQPKRGLMAAAISFLPSLIGMTLMFIFAGLPIYAVYIAGLLPTPLLAWIGYLNGYKLKTLGINIVYRKKR